MVIGMALVWPGHVKPQNDDTYIHRKKEKSTRVEGRRTCRSFVHSLLFRFLRSKYV